MPSSLRWTEAGVRVHLRGDYPGAITGGAPLRMQIGFERIGGGAAGEAAASGERTALEVWVRMPAWVTALRAKASGGLTALGDASAGSLLPLRLAPSASGGLAVELTPEIKWEKIKDTRSQFASLHAALYGPLVLAGLTYAERALPATIALTPVPQSERANLHAVRVHTPRALASGGDADAAADGCLVKRWNSGWLIRTDGVRHFMPRPPADCLARATPIEDTLGNFAQANGGGKGYALEAAQTASACARLDGCLLPEGRSAFASGALFLMHLGAAGTPVVLAAPPPTVNGTRRGGTDAANAATWRLTAAPVGMGLGHRAPSASGGSDAPFYIESFDLPGHVLAVGGKGGAVTLERARADAPTQIWTRGRSSDGKSHVLRSVGAAEGGHLSVRRRAAASGDAAPLAPHRGAAISREWELAISGDAAAIDLGEPFAEYAPTSFWLSAAKGTEAVAPVIAARRPFLLMPLNELMDEHYSVYFCKPASAAEAANPPRFCL